MRKILLGLLLAASVSPAFAGVPVVKDDSYKDAAGGRVLKESVVVPASRADLWKAFTTDAGFTKWAVPVAHIVPGNGGSIEFALASGGKIGDPGNVRNRIDVYEPNALLIFHNEFVPSGGPFDPEAFGRVRTMIAFEDTPGGGTKVTETVIGFGTGATYDQLYEHLRGGNAEYLTMLVNNFQKAS